jgi:uncharacterized Zn finger protein
MECGRCGGFLVVEKEYDEAIAALEPRTLTTRCVNCGNLEDSLIRLNRSPRSFFARTVRNAEGGIEARSNEVLRQSS